MSSKAELGIPSLNSLLEKSGKVFRKLILRPVLLRFEREQNETRKGDPQKKSTEGLENGVANVDGLAKTLQAGHSNQETTIFPGRPNMCS